MEKKNSIVWSFVDIFLVLTVAFLLATYVEQKESSASDKYTPKIYIFIEHPENPTIKYNGRFIHSSQLSRLIQVSLKKNVHQVQVIALIEADVPYGFVDNVKRAALSSKIAKRQSSENYLIVVWDTKILSSFSAN